MTFVMGRAYCCRVGTKECVLSAGMPLPYGAPAPAAPYGYYAAPMPALYNPYATLPYPHHAPRMPPAQVMLFNFAF